MRVRAKAPSAGLVVGGLALVVALSGTAYAVTTSQVNITDPGNAAHKAHVNAMGRLEVGDGSRNTPAGQKEVATAAPSDAVVFSIGNAQTCSAGGVYTPPPGKALIITGVTYFNFPTEPSLSATQILYVGPSATPCQSLVAAGVSTHDGSVPESFDPGVPVPAGDALGVTSENDSGTAVVYGYLVPASSVPATATALKHSSGRPQSIHN